MEFRRSVSWDWWTEMAHKRDNISWSCENCGVRVEITTDGGGELIEYDWGTNRVHKCRWKMADMIETESGTRSKELTFEELNRFEWMMDFVQSKSSLTKASSAMGRSDSYLAGLRAGASGVTREAYDLLKMYVEDLENGKQPEKVEQPEPEPKPQEDPADAELRGFLEGRQSMFGDAMKDLEEADKYFRRLLQRLDIAADHAATGFGKLGIQSFRDQLYNLRREFIEPIVKG